LSKLTEAKQLANTEPDVALALCNEVLNDHFEDEDGQKALFMSGYIMMEAERYGLAYNIYKRCAELNPNISEIWSNMGMCIEEHDPQKALQCFQRALRLKPNNAHALANEGLMRLQTGDPQKCIELSDRALAIEEIRSAKHNKGLAQLMLRQWKEGWKNYADTLGVKHREGRDYGLPDWNGEPGLVVVYGEQGVGDEIMFASCLNEIPNDIVLDCDKRLEGLFKRSFDMPIYGTRYKAATELMDNHEPQYQCAIGQLPYFYRNTDESFPGTPYLVPDPERCLQWRALFDTFKGKKVGIAWNGGIRGTGKARRSIKLDDLAPILDPGNTYISLEYKPVDQDELDKYGIKSYQRATGLRGDIDDLAALINELDYVICPCTTVVYVAGALGVPCHVLVPSKPGYRYHMKGEFPWYNSVQLHRQKGSWAKTIKALRDYDFAHLRRVRPKGSDSVPRPLPLDLKAG